LTTPIARQEADHSPIYAVFAVLDVFRAAIHALGLKLTTRGASAMMAPKFDLPSGGCPRLFSIGPPFTDRGKSDRILKEVDYTSIE